MSRSKQRLGKFWENPIVRDQHNIAGLTWYYLCAYVVVRFEKLHPFYFRKFPDEKPKIESCLALMKRVSELNPLLVTDEMYDEIVVLFEAGMNWLDIAGDFAEWINRQFEISIPECKLITNPSHPDFSKNLYEYCEYKVDSGEWREPTASEVER